jgi:fatty acid desaturase
MSANPETRDLAAARAPLVLDRATLIHITQPIPWRLLAQVGLEWLLIAGAIGAAVQVQAVWLSLVVIVFVGTRQHALLVLMHEFSHRQFSRTRLLWNDLLGDVFTALPFMITLHGFRRDHLKHHRHVSTQHDPNWVASLRQPRFQFPKPRTHLWRELLQHLAGLYMVKDLKGLLFDAGMAVEVPRSILVRQALFALTVAALATAFSLWSVLLLYWLVPMFTVLLTLLYLRDVAEHFAMPSPGIAGSRTVRAGFWERLLVAPHAVGFHTEHHLYPSVPFCRLKRLHRLLSQQKAYREQAVVADSYLGGVLRQAMRYGP